MSRVSVSIIIPSWKGRANTNLDLLARDIDEQTLQPLEVHVIEAVAPLGLARNVGARRASGDVLVFLDDDVRLGHERVLEALVGLLEDPQIGMVGASQLLPPDSSPFQRAAGRQIPRSASPVVRVATDSDMVTACFAIRRALLWELGGFNEDMIRGADPEMRFRVRGRGFRLVVAPNAWFYHPMPSSLIALCRLFFRNGRQSLESVRRAPWAALENPDGHAATFVVRRSTPYRVGRHVVRFLTNLLTLRWIGAVAQCSYLAGYLWRKFQLHWTDRPVETSVVGKDS